MRRIITDTQICHGKAHVEGTRIPVHIVLDLLAGGETCENILQAYPHLTEKDIQACLKYAARLATEEVVYESMVAA
ncbi:unnamed protein product [marine sediment metagenome]|uniref:Antitoxin n=1 Tax=marine sediment metagenome TaxID=412755 RepID=X1BCG4_9ZZZZ